MRTPFSRLTSNSIDPAPSWHAQIKLCAVDTFLYNGLAIDDATAQRLNELTNGLVAHWQRPPAGRAQPEPTGSIDDRVTQLVHDHATQYGGRLEAAVLACLYVVAPQTAIQLLVLLQALPHLIYLRCLQNAAIRNPGLIQHSEFWCAHYLSRLLTAPCDTPDLDALSKTLEEIPRRAGAGRGPGPRGGAI